MSFVLSLNLCDILTVNCLLTDKGGKPLDPLLPNSIMCNELAIPHRKDVEVPLPDGKTITLQKVKVQKQGYVVIEIIGPETTCISDPIPFLFIETFVLCAPDGTKLRCLVTDFSCSANLNCRDGLVTSVDLFFDFCQEVETSAKKIITLSGVFCKPREDIIPSSCQFSIPIHCPSVFPANEKHEKNKQPIKNAKKEIVISEKELTCLSVEKVYDWLVRQNSFHLNFNIDDLTIECEEPPCDLHLFVHAAYVCEDDLQGQVLCDGIPVVGTDITFSAEPGIVTFSPDPTTSDDGGHFDTIVTIPPGTPPTPVTITAVTEVSGLTLTDSLEAVVECPEEECTIELFVSDVIECDGFIAGRVMCGGAPIEGAIIMLESDNPTVVTIAHDQITTGGDGNFFAGIKIEQGTPLTGVTITASTELEGETISASIEVDVECELDCVLTLDVPANIDCEAELTGTISCDGEPEVGAEISFSSHPNILSFTPAPIVSDPNGNFTVTVTVPENTPMTSVLISATTTVNNETVSVHVGTNVECLPVECPCKFRIGVQGNRAPAIVNITEQGEPSKLEGTINVTAVQCFSAAPMCNPAVDNFSITFGSNGSTINFIQGRRIHIDCEGNNVARVHGTAMATGNVFSGVYEVLIEVTVSPGNIGTWSIFAQDLIGNSFETSFTAMMNPISFIGACDEPV